MSAPAESQKDAFAIGLDLGGTQVKGIAADSSGKILAIDSVDTEDDGDDRWRKNLKVLLNKLEDEVGRPADWVGISAPGLQAKDGLAIEYMPGRLQGLERFHWGSFLRDNSLTVPVLNDAHSALSGEVWAGAAQGMQDVFMLTLGTGVGGAILSDGKILKGHIGRAGHLGHVTVDSDGEPDCVKTPGSLEEAIGNKSIEKRTDGKYPTTHALVAAYVSGDEEARKIWLSSVKALAAACASLINALDPEAIIIGGGIAKAEDALFQPFNDFLKDMEWRPGGHSVKILGAKLGENAGALGAAYNAILYSSPQLLKEQ